MEKIFLRLPIIKQRSGLSRSSIYSMMSDGTFPSSIPLSNRAVGWLSSEFDEWQNSKIKARQNISNKSEK